MLDTTLAKQEPDVSQAIGPAEGKPEGSEVTDLDTAAGSVISLDKPIRRRSKAHLAHVRAQTCVVF